MPNTTNTPDILTSREAATYLRVTPETIRAMVRRGDLPAARIGSQMRITRASIDQWIAAQTQAQA